MSLYRENRENQIGFRSNYEQRWLMLEMKQVDRTSLYYVNSYAGAWPVDRVLRRRL